MDIISWMVTGIVVGALMGLMTPRSLHVGFLGSIGMGVLGAVVLCFMGGIIGLYPEQAFSLMGVATAAVGAVGGHIVMMLFRKLAHV